MLTVASKYNGITERLTNRQMNEIDKYHTITALAAAASVAADTARDTVTELNSKLPVTAANAPSSSHAPLLSLLLLLFFFFCFSSYSVELAGTEGQQAHCHDTDNRYKRSPVSGTPYPVYLSTGSLNSHSVSIQNIYLIVIIA